MRLPIAIDYRPALLSVAGIGRAARELARALAQRTDVELHLFAHSFARARVAIDVPAGASLHRWPLPGRGLRALARLGLPADRLAGRVRAFHWIDYVQAPLGRARAVLTVHDLAFVRDAAWHGANTAVLRERTRAAIAAAAAVVVPSHATAADLRAFAPGAPPARVVPFGADHVPANAPRPTRDAGCVLCVGTIEPRKNHLGLLRAWRLLRAPRPPLVVVGRIGWQCDEIVRELRAASAEGLLAWRERADDAELWSLLAHAKALVYPSLWEGFGFPPLEAMQLGVPVVAHDCAALREFGDGACAFADAAVPEALADAIARVLGDDGARARAIAAGRERAAALTWRRCAAEHAAIYREVTAC
jgi:glycosyltransferase involved in cell wall biosynthesis